MVFFNKLLSLPRLQKRLIQVFIDCVLITACFMFAMWLRLDSWVFFFDLDTWLVLFAVVPVTLIVFIRTGFYRAVLRYIGFQATYTVLLGVFASSMAMLLVSQVFDWFVPRSVPIIYLLLATIMIGGSRAFWRALYTEFHASPRVAVAVYGAGSAGRQVVASLRSANEHAPLLFVDDDKNLEGATISGLRVYSSDQLEEILSLNGIEVILLALPDLSRSERRKILQRVESLSVQVQTIPDMGDLISGRASIDDIREVSVEDLLGRDPIPPRPELMTTSVTNKFVMVTGAGGSIGSELCRQLLDLAPKSLVLLEQSEFNLYQIHQELSERIRRHGLSVELHPILGSVQQRPWMEAILRQYDIQTIYHAAAYKHVPLVEKNIAEGVRNNVFGTRNLAQAAVAAGVEAFILVSTDKAVRPTNVMGATKRVAELICQDFAATQDSARFSIVRFGNVLGSSGSVIPRFRSQIAEGGPVTVTDPEITRYFMTIPEAAQLVIQAGALAKGGDVFVLDMGEPVRILDLAERLIRLSGLKPFIAQSETRCGEVYAEKSGDIEIIFSGLRDGEKLYEELLISGKTEETVHPRIITAHEIQLSPLDLARFLEQLWEAVQSQDSTLITELLKGTDIGYRPPDTKDKNLILLKDQAAPGHGKLRSFGGA